MRRARFHRLAGAVITATLVLTSTLPAEALAPIDTTSTEGAHLLTIPLITGSGGGTAVDIADNGWVALSQGLWEGIGYPRRDIAPNPFGSPNPDFTVTAIGTDGTVVGNYPPDGTGRRSLFVRRPDGTIVTPGAPPGDSGALAVVPVGISDEGYIAGTSTRWATPVARRRAGRAASWPRPTLTGTTRCRPCRRRQPGGGSSPRPSVDWPPDPAS